jgi:phosphate-selective porin OprO/OprP
MTAKRVAVAVAAVCATLSAPSYAADDVKNLLDLMLKKGVISQQDYDQFINENKDATENKQFKEKRIDDDVAKSAKYIQKHEKDGSVKPSGFGWVSEDGKNEVNLTGRLHYDARAFDNNFGTTNDRDASSMGDRFTARRARLGVTGVLNKDFTYEMIANLTGTNANATNSTTSTALIDTAWINYMPNPAAQIRVGKFKQPFGLETLTSSNNIDFMERSYQDQIAPGKQLGVMMHGDIDANTVYAISGYQKDFDPASSNGSLAPEIAGRFATNLAKAFGAGDNVLLHVGIAGTAGKSSVVPTTSSQNGHASETKGAFVAFNDENSGLKNVFRNRIYGTPPCSSPSSGVCSIDGYSLAASEAATVKKNMYGLELAAAYSATKFQAEYSQASYNAQSRASTGASNTFYDTQSKGDVKVYYFELIHNLTNESWASTYKNGVIGAVKPNSSFSFKDMAGTGAWQLAARFSKYDASNFGANSSGGETKYSANGGASSSTTESYSLEGSPTGTTTTVGLNWILNPNARIMLNYSVSKFTTTFTPVDISNTTQGNTEKIVSLRSQFNF